MTNPLRYPHETPPAAGEAIEVAPGVLWMRLPLPMKLDHVNIYALDEGDSWTVIDTGFDTGKARREWELLLEGPLKGKPIGRIIVTHHHPDHVGCAGWLMERFGAELWMTRTAWLTARMLTLDAQDRPTVETVNFWKSCGMDADTLDQRLNERPFNFADVCAPLPLGYRRIRAGEVIRIGGRDWDVHIGNGHAPSHATFWSRDDNLVIAGDQIIASISPNVGLYATEPLADPLGEWLESCERLRRLAREDHFVLAGHKLPFTGLPTRMRQLIDNHHGGLDRLREHLKTSRTAHECFPPLFKRTIGAVEYGLALVEAMAHTSHLWHLGEATCETRSDGAYVFQTS